MAEMPHGLWFLSRKQEHIRLTLSIMDDTSNNIEYKQTSFRRMTEKCRQYRGGKERGERSII